MKSVKILLLSALLASATVMLHADDTPALSGNWQVHNDIAGNESDQSCTFTQKGTDLTGSCSSDSGSVAVTGRINGKNITWSYKSEYNGQPLTVIYNGGMESSTKIVGSVSVPEFGADGDFTATQSNAPAGH